MKTLYKNISIISLLIMMAMGFNSCTRDEVVGMNINGHWFGDMDMYNAYTGERARGSEIEFCGAWSNTRGTGYQIDYYNYARPVRNDFDWEVINGVIYLRFVSDPDLDCTICDYNLGSYYFNGYIDNYDGSSTYFNLRSYNYYWNEYGYEVYYTRGDNEATDSVQVKGIRGCNMKKTSEQ